MKNARPIPKNQPSGRTSFEQPNCITARAILAKAAPWLALQSVVVLALTLSVGGLAL